MKVIWPPWIFWPYFGIAIATLIEISRHRSEPGVIAILMIVLIIVYLKLKEIRERGDKREKPKPAFGSTERDNYQKLDRKP